MKAKPPGQQASPREQPPAVDHLEQRGVTVSSQHPLAPGLHRPVHLVIGVIQEPLHPLTRQRAGLRAARIVVQVHDRVPLVADRHRERAERLLARHRPPVPGVSQVLAEQPQISLVTADRRRRQMPLRGQRQRPLIHMRRPPLPRELVGEGLEAAHEPLPVTSRIRPQATRGLLRPPAPQHRLHHRVLRTQLQDAVQELSACRTRQANRLQPGLPSSIDGRIMHHTGSLDPLATPEAPQIPLIRLGCQAANCRRPAVPSPI